MSDSLSLIELVRQFQQASRCEDRERLAEEIVRRLDRDLRVCLWGRCHQQDVDDVLQATYAAIFRGLGKFEGEDDANFRAWVRTIARRKAVDLQRGHAGEPTSPRNAESLDKLLAESSAGVPATSPEDFEMQDALRRLRELDSTCFEYLWNCYVLGMTYEEMACSRGVSVDAMRMRVKRCREKAENNSNDWR